MKKSPVIHYKLFCVFLFFIPIYIIKGIGLGGTDRLAIIVTMLSSLVSLLALPRMEIKKTELIKWVAFFSVCTLNVFLSGKCILLLSVYALFLLINVDYKKCYKFILAISFGILIYWVIVSIDSGTEAYRFINGSWQTITKRSNTIFVIYFEFICLYVLIRGKSLSCLEILAFLVGSAFLYGFTGTRSGFACVIFCCCCLIAYKLKIVKKSKLIKKLVVLSPLIFILVSFSMNYLYGKIDILNYLNNMLQNRLYWGKLYLSKYGISLIGQRIFTSTDHANYQILDNTYLNLLINYGFVITLFWLYLNVCTFKYLYRNKEYNKICIILSYLVYAFVESFVIVAFLNISIFIYSDYLINKRKELSRYKKMGRS